MQKGRVKEKKVHVQVFVTKGRKFRAQITEGKNRYQVTIGGNNWKAGLGRKYEQEILRKSEILVAHLQAGLAIFADNYSE